MADKTTAHYQVRTFGSLQRQTGTLDEALDFAERYVQANPQRVLTIYRAIRVVRATPTPVVVEVLDVADRP